MANKKQQKNWQATCTFMGAFIEIRYDEPKKIPAGDERTAYQVYCFCGLIDSDGMKSLLEQPKSERLAMYRSARKLGLVRLVKEAQEAAKALRKAGLSFKREKDRAAITALLRPFEKRYFGRFRMDAYKRLYEFFYSREVFVPYAINCQRIEREGGHLYDPKEWRPPKFKGGGGD